MADTTEDILGPNAYERPTLAGRPFDPAALRKTTVTLDIETEYPAALNVGDTIHSDSGFLIGTITDVVSQGGAR